MIVSEFSGNTLAEKNQDANALSKPEKPANGDFANHLNSTNCHSQAKNTDHQLLMEKLGLQCPEKML